MPPQSDRESRIDELTESLYSRNAPDVRTRRRIRIDETNAAVPTDWQRPAPRPEPVPQAPKPPKPRMSFLTKLLIFSLCFCIVAVGIGAYIFLNGSNLISADNIDVVVNGPVSIPGGEPVSFDIKVTNKNNVDLQDANLTINYPDGSANINDPTQALKTDDQYIGNLPAGQSVTKTVQAMIFGEANLQKQIVAVVNYKVKGSLSQFSKKTSYDILINSSPISLTVSSFKEITSGQSFDMTVTLKSNSQEVLKNILLLANYPYGYTFTSSSQVSQNGNTTWSIGTLNPGQQKTIRITGTLVGEDTDIKAFHFTVGAQSTVNPTTVGTVYMATEQDFTLQKPFVSLDVSVDGNDTGDTAVGAFSQANRVDINWSNNLSAPVTNAEIVAKLSGSAYDKFSVQPASGTFRSANDQIVWNRQTNGELASLGAGASGKVSFTITPKDTGTARAPLTNPVINIDISVSGSRTQESHVPQSLTSASSKKIKVATVPTLTGKIVRSVGPFTNSGPVPPRVDQVSTYTVIWTVDNTSNALTNAVVTASLPAYVKWMGNVSPSSENVTYDQNTGKITWNVGNVSTYTVNADRRREVAFQISFQPSATDVGSTPTIINQASLTAKDSFTGSMLSDQQDYLTTRFSTDPTYHDGSGVVGR